MKRKYLIIFIIGIAIALAGITVIVVHLATKANRKAVYDDIKPTQVETTTEEETSLTPKVDFNELQELNSDIYAWIEIPDTTISYPVVQGGPHENYYLDHTIEHEAGFPGAIYTQLINSKSFEDFNTVIYGHELADNSMFTPLHGYMDPEFFNSHREIKIYTPEKEITYKVFAAITYDDRLILGYYDNENEYSRKEFLESVYGNRFMSDNFADDIEVTENDKIITLSTCIYDLPNNRYLVLAVKTGEESY